MVEVDTDCDLTVCNKCLSEGAKFPNKEVRQTAKWQRPKTDADAIKTGLIFD